MPRQNLKRIAEQLDNPHIKRAAVITAQAIGGPLAGAAVELGHGLAVNNMPSYGRGEFTTSKSKRGRRVKRMTNKYTKLMLKAAVSKVVVGLNSFTTGYGSYGKYFLRNYFDTRAQGPPNYYGGYYLPIHLWDVSCIPNTLDSTSTPINAQCGYRVGLTTPLAGNTVLHRTMGPPCVNVHSPGPSTDTQTAMRAGSLLRGIRYKLMFYSRTSYPSRVKVALVQFSDGKLLPSKNQISDTAGTKTDQGVTQADNTQLPDDGGEAPLVASAFWQQLAQSYVSNPCLIQQGNVTRGMKIIEQTNFILNPKESTDATSATYHMIDKYHTFTRRQNYNWGDTAQVYPLAAEAMAQSRGQNKCCVDPRARIYLLIMADGAYATGDVDPPANDSANSVSYDISLRMYHDDIV